MLADDEENRIRPIFSASCRVKSYIWFWSPDNDDDFI
jgi:hypothetical protein